VIRPIVAPLEKFLDSFRREHGQRRQQRFVFDGPPLRKGQIKGYVLSGVQRRVWRFRTVDLDATLEVPAVLTAEAE
jgi:hypothetical protein